MTKHVVVVGAGPGGLCAAMLLASRGFQVTVLEKQPALGGRSGALRLGPYTFDRGSTMLMMRFVSILHHMCIQLRFQCITGQPPFGNLPYLRLSVKECLAKLRRQDRQIRSKGALVLSWKGESIWHTQQKQHVGLVEIFVFALRK